MNDNFKALLTFGVQTHDTRFAASHVKKKLIAAFGTS